MERILRHTILRRNQLLKKARKNDLKQLRAEWREYNLHKQAQQMAMHNLVVDERKHRREDWICGPLAPRRDVGQMKGQYGSLPSVLQQGPKPPSRYTRLPKGRGEDYRGSEDRSVSADGEWRGTGLLGNIVVGDRVAVIRGRPDVKGKIGEVYRVENETHQVFIRDLNKVDVTVPPFATNIKDKYQPTELGINISDIRLVDDFEDENAGTHRDVIIREVKADGPYFEREPNSNIPRHTRYAVGAGPNGEDLEISWPPAQEAREYNQDSDTPSQFVFDTTYVPTVREPAFPVDVPFSDGIIDELRSKYSRTRKMHDDTAWVQKKILEDMRSSWLKRRATAVMGGSPFRPPYKHDLGVRAKHVTPGTKQLIEKVQAMKM